MALSKGAIVWVPFPYSDQRQSKRRPACVVSVETYQRGPDVIVAMVTSQRRWRENPGLGDVVVDDWRGAGLWAASTIRAGRLLVLDQAHVAPTPLGVLPDGELARVDDALRAVLGLR